VVGNDGSTNRYRCHAGTSGTVGRERADEFKIRKVRAEILGLGSVIRQLQQAGMHDAVALPEEGVPRIPDETTPWKSTCRVVIISEEWFC
jgi:hypothetical protein